VKAVFLVATAHPTHVKSNVDSTAAVAPLAVHETVFPVDVNPAGLLSSVTIQSLVTPFTKARPKAVAAGFKVQVVT